MSQGLCQSGDDESGTVSRWRSRVRDCVKVEMMSQGLCQGGGDELGPVSRWR